MADDWAEYADEQEKIAAKMASMQLPKTAASGDPTLPPVTTFMPTSSTVTSAAASTVSNLASPGSSPVDGTGANDDDESAPSMADVSLINKRLHDQLVKTTSDIEVLRKDPNSPLYHVKSFEALNLKPDLLKGVYGMGFNAPSKIQETALPALLADPPTNIIAQSQSGTGKTAAFVLTMLSRVVVSNQWPQCLCLAPTYELALQIGDVTKQMSKYMSDLRIAYAVRGERVMRGESLQDHIVIGTPGTMLDWCTKIRAIDLKKINVFVLDEADVMIDTQGHQDQSIRIQRGLRRDCQLLLFSATYDEKVMRFAETIVHDAFIIKLRREEQSLDNIKQFYIECRDQDDKFQALSNIYGSISIGQSMIFCHTKRTASWLCEKMTSEGHAVALLSGELDVTQRAAVIGRFRSGREKVLITTNVSARGIDVEQVTVVVNFDLPITMDRKPDCETYLHRIGRTGRFGKQGLAINMIDSQQSRQIMQAIESHFGRKCTRLDAQDMDELEKIGTE